MRNLIWLSAAVLALMSPTFGEEGAEVSKEEIAKLIEELPTPAVLQSQCNIAHSNQPNKYTEQAKQEATAMIARTKEIIPKLRKSLKTGASVFNYPGLLCKGDISFDAGLETYTLYLGVSLMPEGGEGTVRTKFKITFDSKGKILRVENVVSKA